jgi:hypothetical protein
VVEISPVRLKKEVQWIDVANALIGANNQNIVEDKSVRYGVGVTDRDEH